MKRPYDPHSGGDFPSPVDERLPPSWRDWPFWLGAAAVLVIGGWAVAVFVW